MGVCKIYNVEYQTLESRKCVSQIVIVNSHESSRNINQTSDENKEKYQFEDN